MNNIANIAAVEVGQHWYWTLGSYTIHGQVLLSTWIVFSIIFAGVSVAGSTLRISKPSNGQIILESLVSFVRDLAKTQVGEEQFLKWVPFVGTLFLFIPLKLLILPSGELASPTNDINTTVALALLTSLSYFYAGLSTKGLGYFSRYLEPTPVLLPINILEDFTKPLSLSFRLFGNILADELVVAVLVSLVPLVVPVPMMFLGLFTSGIQALIFATLAGAYIGEALEDHH